MTMSIKKTMGMDISMDHAGMVICRFKSMGRSVDRCMGGDKDMGLVGDTGMRWVLGHFHLREILGPSWFQLLWPCNIENNLNKDCLTKITTKKKVKSCTAPYEVALIGRADL